MNFEESQSKEVKSEAVPSKAEGGMDGMGYLVI